MKLRLTVDHSAGTVEWESRTTGSGSQAEAAAEAFQAFASAGPDTEIKVPGRDGPVLLRAGDIDRFDLTWEA
jgi:hypothetical protein